MFVLLFQDDEIMESYACRFFILSVYFSYFLLHYSLTICYCIFLCCRVPGS
jgi:hypothetical protein